MIQVTGLHGQRPPLTLASRVTLFVRIYVRGVRGTWVVPAMTGAIQRVAMMRMATPSNPLKCVNVAKTLAGVKAMATFVSVVTFAVSVDFICSEMVYMGYKNK